MSEPIEGVPVEAQSEAELGAALAASGASAVDTDVNELLKQLLATQASLQAQVDALQAEKAQAKAEPVKATAEALKNAILEHASGKTTGNPSIDHSALISLAEDAIAAAAEAVLPGGTGVALAGIAVRIERALTRFNPGPGDHHYFRAAQSQAADLVDQAENLAPVPATAGAIGTDRAPAKVLAGSVVG